MSNPSHSIPTVQIPTGGELLGFANAHPASSECAAIINLQTQVAPLIASMSCQIKVLKLLKPLIEIVNGLPNPNVAALEAFSEAAVALAPCLLISTPTALLPFVHDLLCIEIKSMKCFLGSLQSLLRRADANRRSISQSQVRAVLDSYPPIVGTLTLAGELFALAGLTIPQPPVLGDGTDVAALNADYEAVAGFVTAIQTLADTIGGCS
jgi:hypothetical protein